MKATRLHVQCTTLTTALLVAAAVFSAGAPLTAAPGDAARIPVVFATDIGGDIDDTWALAQLLRTPELDLKLVLTETGEARYRAAVTAKLLEIAGRSDVAVGLGRDFGAMEEKDRNQGPWIRGYDLAKYPGTVHEDGVGAFLKLAKETPLTVIAVGPAPSLAAAMERDASVAKHCRLIGMFGSFDVGYGGESTPAAEYNVKADPAALRTVLAAPWREIVITPLDTCGLITLADGNYQEIWCATGDPLLRAVIENYCIFAPRTSWMHCDFFATRSTVLFDCVAVTLATDESLMQVDTVPFRVTDDGMTVRDPSGPYKARVALRWKDRVAYERGLTATLRRPATPPTR